MVKYNLHLQNTIATMAGQVAGAMAAPALANANAANAQVVAQAAGNVDRFRPAAPPKYGNKKNDADVRQWLPVIEDYLRTAPNADYIRLASFYLEGGPRSLSTSLVSEAYKAAHARAEPGNPRQFFRQTLEANYGLQDLNQKYWDTWNSLRQGPSQDITEYNINFQQTLTDLAGHVTRRRTGEDREVSCWPPVRRTCATQPTSDRRPNKTSTSPTVKVAKNFRIFTVLRRVLLQYLFCTSDSGMRAQTAVFNGPSARAELQHYPTVRQNRPGCPG
jgi:hypothetical protein